MAERIYQVRGFDVSTVTFIDAGAGWIVVDPLTTVEVARAALELVHEQLPEKPVLAVIYSHSHVDHYGGVGGVTTAADAAAGKVKVIAPEGFLEHAVSENIIAGPAMLRRARFQFGQTLPPGAQGEMTSGLGPRPSAGSSKPARLPPADTGSRPRSRSTGGAWADPPRGAGWPASRRR